MADEAFALSPISARPAMPSDADYDAIREAFMETSRGRWFLSEYAKRNRNADTTMVLDAVARIEQTLAAQKQAQAEAAGESLAALRAVIGEARACVAKAIATLDDTATLAAAHRGARAVSEVAATLRECGADARICDLLDQQVAAIDGGHRLVAAIDRNAIEAAFDRMLQHVAAISGGSPTAHTAPETTARATAPAAADAASPAAAEQHSPAPEAAAPQATAQQPAEPTPPASLAAPQPPADAAVMMVTGVDADELEFVETAEEPEQTAAEAVAPQALAAEASANAGPIAQPNDAADLLDEVVALEADGSEDESVLDLVAREMSAPDVSAPYRPENDAYEAAAASTAEEIESDIAALQQALSEEIAVAPEPIPADEAPAFSADAFAADAFAADAFATDTFDLPAEPELDAVASAEPSFEPTGEIGESAPVMTVAAPAPVETAAAQMPAATAISDQAIASAPASLGAAALASGAVAAPSPMRSDALVPFRRMSQSEKIAFFS
ncbi:hypothetical protein DNX69_24815 [Rhodopseudomonas palustris]|uniref:Uncharacterized protein n=1 Tax=Rhodopseudomonas palustris TaxID=1076 RepID=A0A323UAZ7_RHOPL|nr:hypothetical protein [Rhodopseudomonas palustris]PZA09429.1 hypothetical protein DNX69_24815 [Rhodopseudomonas palustris]